MNLLDVNIPQISRAIQERRESILRALSHHVYQFLGMNIFLRLAEHAPTNMVKVNLSHLGKSFSVYVDSALVDAFLAPYAMKLHGLSEEAIKLFVLSIEGLPDGVAIENLEFVTAPDSLVFECISYDNGKPLGWKIAFSLEEDIPLGQLLEALSDHLHGIMAHPLAVLPITLPLVVCRLDIPMSDLCDMEPGDILLLEGGA